MLKSLATAALAATLLASAAPALAENDKTPPGNPCAKGNGNPCNGNNGNQGQQGNSGGNHDDGVVYGPAPHISIPRPAVRDRGVFIAQVGNGNAATVTQTAQHARGEVRQTGDHNYASVTQGGGAIAYADLRQTGIMNDATVTQGGASGGNTLYVRQTGAHNSASVHQTAASGGESGAIVTQNGVANSLALYQSGSDNAALLTQQGDGNRMTASQTGDGNRLAWTQIGNNVSNLGISQTGGGSLQITQTR